MKERIKKITESKSFIIALIVLLIALVIGAGTYAWFTWSSTDNTSITLTIGKLADVTFTTGPDININDLAPVFNYYDGESTTFSINNRDTSGSPVTYTVKLNISHIDNELISSDFKFVLLEGTNIISEDNFSTASSGGTLNIGSGLIKPGTTNYTIYFYIDGNNENNSNMMNKNLTGTIVVSGIDGTPSYITLTNLGLTVDTAHTPDFSTCSGNSCTYHDNSTGDETSGHGDSTNGIYSAPDDLGTSYYFRGDVNNNYVSFAGKTWRIVRINGDGTVRIALNESAGISPFNSAGYIFRPVLNGSAGTSAFNLNYTGYTVRPVLNESFDNTHVGYMYGTPGSSTYEATHANTNNSTIKTFLDNWYDTNLSSYSSYIADSIFCNDRSLSNVSDYWGEVATNTGIGTAVTAYSGYKRTYVDHNPSLICPNNNDKFTVSSLIGNGALTKPIGLLTIDEYIMAGAGPRDATTGRYYKYTSSSGAFYLYDNSNWYWSMSPDGYAWGPAHASYVYGGGSVDSYYVHYNFAVRPAVSLKFDAIIGGTGTSSDPFVVS